MPFFNDIGVRVEEHQGPLWSTFAILADQIERMVALNLAWSLQLVPMLIGLGFHELPWWLRAPLLAYTGLALGPATAALFGMVARAGEGELLTLEVAREVLGALAAPGLTRLVPLYSAFAWLGLAAAISADAGLLALDVLARLAMLLVGLGAIYWGPLLALRPGLSAPRM
ncbi:MAG: hypothetical protein QME94_06895, partial [Anaerolineae bacterium]|nr:hypothetical protein [Anaerolineae bacterium]